MIRTLRLALLLLAGGAACALAVGGGAGLAAIGAGLGAGLAWGVGGGLVLCGAGAGWALVEDRRGAQRTRLLQWEWRLYCAAQERALAQYTPNRLEDRE